LFTESCLPSVALGKRFTECLSIFAECLSHSVINQYPVVNHVWYVVVVEQQE
jgi:hypothetical protein